MSASRRTYLLRALVRAARARRRAAVFRQISVRHALTILTAPAGPAFAAAPLAATC